MACVAVQCVQIWKRRSGRRPPSQAGGRTRTRCQVCWRRVISLAGRRSHPTPCAVPVSPVLQCRGLDIASQEHREPERRRVNMVFTTDELFVVSPDRDVQVEYGARYSNIWKPFHVVEKRGDVACFHLPAGTFDVNVRYAGTVHASTHKFIVTGASGAGATIDAVLPAVDVWGLVVSWVCCPRCAADPD